MYVSFQYRSTALRRPVVEESRRNCQACSQNSRWDRPLRRQRSRVVRRVAAEVGRRRTGEKSVGVGMVSIVAIPSANLRF